MRRWLLLMLLLVLPLQLVWATAAPYCAHEQGAVKHFGHHQHQHKYKDASSGKATSGAGQHLDCTSCHLAAPTVPSALQVGQIAGNGAPAPAAPPNYSSCILDGPERPDRSSTLSAVRFGSGGAPVLHS